LEGDKVQMFQFCYTLNENDYFEFNKYHAFNSPASRKNMIIYRFIVPIIFVACGLIAGTIVDEPVVTYYFYIAFGIVAILWLIFFKPLMAKQIKKNIGRIKKSGKLPYQSNVTISFEDDFFVETTENGEARVKYSTIERVIITEKAIYIYINAVQAILLPFTVFSDEQKHDDFIVFIEEKRAGCL